MAEVTAKEFYSEMSQLKEDVSKIVSDGVHRIEAKLDTKVEKLDERLDILESTVAIIQDRAKTRRFWQNITMTGVVTLLVTIGAGLIMYIFKIN